MKKIFNRTENMKEYFKAFSSMNESIDKIPLYISEDRKDLESTIDNFEKSSPNLTRVYKATLGLILSAEAFGFKEGRILANRWIDEINLAEESFPSASIVIIGLYKDFTQKKVLHLMEFCRNKKIEAYFLLGRDLSSLTWMIAKQFTHFRNREKEQKAIFSYKKLSKVRDHNSDWQFYDSKDLENKNIKQILENKTWDSLIFHGHGKEDHLNLADYTLHGLNPSIQKAEPFAPSIGHEGQEFFKDEDKAIPLNLLKTHNLYLLSCNNFPFDDSRLYDARYNLVLNAIDGFTTNIVASLSVQSADNPELAEILQNSDTTRIGVRLHEKLELIQPFLSIIGIGLPPITSSPVVQPSPSYRLTPLSRAILSRLSSYISSTMLERDHRIYRLAQKIIDDYSQITRRGTYGISQEDTLQFEKNLIDRVNPFSKQIAQIMLENPNDPLQDFDTFNIFRSIANEKTLTAGTCSCGGATRSFHYIPEISSIFPLVSTYCYRCGDKSTAMTSMPKIDFTCDEYNYSGYSISYSITVTSELAGDVYLAVQLPGYVADSAQEQDQIHRLKFKTPNSRTLEGKFTFKPDTILQSYYLKLFAVQNGGIVFSRCFFYLVEEDTNYVSGTNI